LKSIREKGTFLPIIAIICVMKIGRFENAIVWQKAHILTLAVYKELRAIKDFAFRDQIQRASVSIMNNIAEGLDRSSKKELCYFLYIAKGSCAEVRSMLYLCADLEYLSRDKVEDLQKQTLEISYMLTAFIKSQTNKP
jgi:four helix bundle protein